MTENELMHYGVLGMKWGHRKAQKVSNARRKPKSSGLPMNKKIGKQLTSMASKHSEKVKKHDTRIEKMTDLVGAKGVVATTATSLAIKYAAKGALARTLNSATNVYISSPRGNYHAKRGADFVRKAAITGLSASYYIDMAKAARDVGTAYVYAAQKNNHK